MARLLFVCRACQHESLSALDARNHAIANREKDRAHAKIAVAFEIAAYETIQRVAREKCSTDVRLDLRERIIEHTDPSMAPRAV